MALRNREDSGIADYLAFLLVTSINILIMNLLSRDDARCFILWVHAIIPVKWFTEVQGEKQWVVQFQFPQNQSP